MSRNSFSVGMKSQSKSSSSKSGFNYQKEVKQLKKDIRLKDEKMTLLQKEIKHKNDTIQLLQEALQTKDEQLSIKDEEYINFEQNVRLLTDKCEALEKHNEELKAENTKQSKLANAANKKAQTTDALNQSLRNEINQLAASISTLRLTMAMGSAQNTFTFAPSTTQILQTAPNTQSPHEPGNNINSGPHGQPQHLRSSQSVALPLSHGTRTGVEIPVANQSEHGTADRDSMDEHDQESDLDLDSEGPPPSVPRAQSMSTMLSPKQIKKMKKKRKSASIRNTVSTRNVLETPPPTEGTGRTRSGSGGSIKSSRSWDNEYDAVSVGSSDRGGGGSGKVKNRQFRSISSSVSMVNVGGGSKSKSKKMKMEIEEAVPEIVEELWDDDAKEDDEVDTLSQADYDFGNAPLEERKKSGKKRKKSKNEWSIYFDTYLDGMDADKLKIKNGTTINMDYFTDSLYIISSSGINSGKHEWEIEVLKTGDLADEIGICSDWGDLQANNSQIADMGSSQLSARCVYANDPSTGVAFHDAYDENNKLTFDKKFKKKGATASEWVWGKGDVIKVAVNLNRWSCKFYLNGKQVGKSISIAKDRTYYPILCAYGSCSYRVISYT